MKIPKSWITGPVLVTQTTSEEQSKTSRQQTPNASRYQTPKASRHQTPKASRHLTPKTSRHQTPKTSRHQTPKSLRHQISPLNDDDEDTYYVTLLRKLEAEVLEKQENNEDDNEEEDKCKCSCSKVFHYILISFILLTFLLLAFAMMAAGFLLELEESAGFLYDSHSSRCRGTWTSIWFLIGGFSIILCYLVIYFLFVKPLQCSKLLSIFIIHLFTISWWLVGCVWFCGYESSCRLSPVGIFHGCALLLPLATLLLIILPYTIKTCCWLRINQCCRQQQEQEEENWDWISETTTSEKII